MVVCVSCFLCTAGSRDSTLVVNPIRFDLFKRNSIVVVGFEQTTYSTVGQDGQTRVSA